MFGAIVVTHCILKTALDLMPDGAYWIKALDLVL